MSIYAIGDIQGCANQLDALINKIQKISPDAKYWFAGDLVNRGPGSLKALRKVKSLGDKAISVLGNHDLHLLAVASGIRPMKAGDTLQDILDAPDCGELIDWVRHRPLAYGFENYLMVHAGVLPQWSAQKTLLLAKEVESVLQSDNWQEFLKEMYGNQPNYWDDSLTGMNRLRAIVNALTRLRFCDNEGIMDLANKTEKASIGYQRWFDVSNRVCQDKIIVFGHWSALGLVLQDRLIGLDTGCIWGGQLTAIRLSDRHRVSVICDEFPNPFLTLTQ